MNLELVWAAGFFDGEGSTLCVTQKPRANLPRGWAGLRVVVTQVEREPLERFWGAVGGYGRLRGPCAVTNPRGQPINTWAASGREAAATLTLLWPFLCQPKRAQANAAMAAVKEWQIANPITNPKRLRRETVRMGERQLTVEQLIGEDEGIKFGTDAETVRLVRNRSGVMK